MAGQASTFSWFQWHFHPDVVIGVLLLLGLYLWGVGPLRRKYGWAEEVASSKVMWFLGGLIVIYVALTSFIHELAENYLFSAHMVQHLLITLAGPPMLLAGTPGWLLRPLLKNRYVFAFAKFVTKPLAAFIVFNFILGIWHLPAMYDLTLFHRLPHIIEHLMFISAAVIMWWPLMSPLAEVPRATYPVQTLYLFGMSLPMGIIGAAITFSPNVLYSWYATVPRLWGLPLMEDQQIAGLIMKVPGGIFFLLLMAVVFFAWFNQDEKGEVSTGYHEFLPEEQPGPASRPH